MQIVIEASGFFRDGQDIEVRRYFADCLTLLIRDKPQVRFTLINAGIFSPEELTRMSAETMEIRNRLPGNLGRIFARLFQPGKYGSWKIKDSAGCLDPPTFCQGICRTVEICQPFGFKRKGYSAHGRPIKCHSIGCGVFHFQGKNCTGAPGL